MGGDTHGQRTREDRDKPDSGGADHSLGSLACRGRLLLPWTKQSGGLSAIACRAELEHAGASNGAEPAADSENTG